jgi:hypothetical protein
LFRARILVLGASATALGQLLISYRYEPNFVGGAIVILFGLFLIGLIRPAWMMREARFHADIAGGRAASAYVLGLAFAFGWTPCIGPILGAILTVGAASATGRRCPACHLFARPRHSVPACCSVHRQPYEAAKGDATDGPCAPVLRRRNHDHHGVGYDNRADVDVFILASRSISHTWSNRLKVGKGHRPWPA